MRSIETIIYEATQPDKSGYRLNSKSKDWDSKFNYFKTIIDSIKVKTSIPLKLSKFAIKKNSVKGFENVSVGGGDLTVLVDMYNGYPNSTKYIKRIETPGGKHNRYILFKKEDIEEKECNTVEDNSTPVINYDVIVNKAVELYDKMYLKFGGNYHFKTKDLIHNIKLAEEFNLDTTFNSAHLSKAKKIVNTDNKHPYYIETLGGSIGSRFVPRQLSISFPSE
jgi:hypothetical protein